MPARKQGTNIEDKRCIVSAREGDRRTRHARNSAYTLDKAKGWNLKQHLLN